MNQELPIKRSVPAGYREACDAANCDVARVKWLELEMQRQQQRADSATEDLSFSEQERESLKKRIRQLEAALDEQEEATERKAQGLSDAQKENKTLRFKLGQQGLEILLLQQQLEGAKRKIKADERAGAAISAVSAAAWGSHQQLLRKLFTLVVRASVAVEALKGTVGHNSMGPYKAGTPAGLGQCMEVLESLVALRHTCAQLLSAGGIHSGLPTDDAPAPVPAPPTPTPAPAAAPARGPVAKAAAGSGAQAGPRGSAQGMMQQPSTPTGQHGMCSSAALSRPACPTGSMHAASASPRIYAGASVTRMHGHCASFSGGQAVAPGTSSISTHNLSRDCHIGATTHNGVFYREPSRHDACSSCSCQECQQEGQPGGYYCQAAATSCGTGAAQHSPSTQRLLKIKAMRAAAARELRSRVIGTSPKHASTSSHGYEPEAHASDFGARCRSCGGSGYMGAAAGSDPVPQCWMAGNPTADNSCSGNGGYGQCHNTHSDNYGRGGWCS